MRASCHRILAAVCQIALFALRAWPAWGAEVASPGGQAPLFWTYQDFLAGKIPRTYTVKRGHPRLLITPENRDEIIARARAAPRLFERTIALAEKGSGESAILACGAIYQLGPIPGFQYARTREAYGRRGVELLMALVQAKNVENGWGFGGYRLGIPCGYDWLHSLLSPQQRQAVVKELIRLADGEAPPGADASGRPRRSSGRLSGPNAPSGTQRMTMGLAFYGDGVADAAAKRIVDSTFRQIWWNADRGRTWPSVIHMVLFLPDGGWTEGASYFGFNYKAFPHFAIWKTATGQDYLAGMGYFRNIPYWMAHSVVPNLPKGRPINTYVVPFFRYHSRGVVCNKMMTAATGYLKDVDPAGAALAQWWIKRHPGRGAGNTPDLVCGLLMGEPRVTPRSPTDLKLPKTLVMRGANLVFMRSAWEDPDATIVGFGNNRFHTYRAEIHNGFCLWKNGGPLFPFRGHVAGHNYYGAAAVPDNNVVYYRGTEPVIVPHVTGVTKPPRACIGSAIDIGTLRVHSVPGQADYLVGECGRGYRGGQVKRSERTLVYLRPAGTGGVDHLVIRDRTETGSPSLVPHVVFQTILEPKIGDDWARQAVGDVVLPGQWRFDACRCVTVTNDQPYGERYPQKVHARAFLRTLLPESTRVLMVGGEGHALDDLAGKSTTRRLWGDLGRQGSRVDKIAFGGLWRFHVVPKVAATKHTFLHVIEATDSQVAAPGTLELLKATGAVAAQVGPNVVVFAADDKPLRSASVTVAGETTRLVAGDLVPGRRYALEAGGTTHLEQASAAGSLLVSGLRLKAGSVVHIRPAAGRGARGE
jgi:hypothetical protein